jgi:uncharacterized protein with HEPN domain
MAKSAKLRLQSCDCKAATAKLRLLDALEAIASINSFIGSLPLEDFLANAMVQAAVLFKLGVIGEALNKAAELDDSLREAIPDLGKIIGMRNRIVHAYDQIDFEILWDAIHSDLPDLKIRLEN